MCYTVRFVYSRRFQITNPKNSKTICKNYNKLLIIAHTTYFSYVILYINFFFGYFTFIFYIFILVHQKMQNFKNLYIFKSLEIFYTLPLKIYKCINSANFLFSFMF